MPAPVLDAAAQTVEERVDDRRNAERGQGMVEYAFILILVAMVVLVAVALLGRTTMNLYSNVSSGLGP